MGIREGMGGVRQREHQSYDAGKGRNLAPVERVGFHEGGGVLWEKQGVGMGGPCAEEFAGNKNLSEILSDRENISQIMQVKRR